MTYEEIMGKNITLSFEFSLYVMEHSDFAQSIPKDARVVLLPKDDAELARINRETAEKSQALDDVADRPVVYVEFKGLRPARSRLVGPRLVSAAVN